MRYVRGLLIVLLAPLIASCYATGHVPLRGGASLEHATGVRTLSGEQIKFAVPGATITNDTLRAAGKDALIAIPTDSIAEILVRKFSWRYTAGLVGIVVGVPYFVWLAHAFGNLKSSK